MTKLTKPIIFEEGDGYRVKAYRLEGTHAKFFGKAFEFVILEWQHPNYGYWSDAMFWWRSMHTGSWQPVAIVSWCSRYETPEDFLEEYPVFRKLFKDTEERDPSVIKRALDEIIK
jgi:hypothetical protein